MLYRQNTLLCVEMLSRLWHGSGDMASKMTCTGLMGKAILTSLLVCVLVAGIPMGEVHSHEDATFGHSHDAHDLFDDHDADETDTEDGDADTASSHAHNVNATSVSLIVSASVHFAVLQHSHSYIPPPYSRLPDKIVAPLYRPPIA